MHRVNRIPRTRGHHPKYTLYHRPMNAPSPSSPVDFQPTLRGLSLTLRPLRADDLNALHAAAADPLIWAQHPDPTRHERAIFEERFFAGALSSWSPITQRAR
jgi:RimJ/RimL family protein N-acetyltransferase